MLQFITPIINPNDKRPIWFSVPGHKTPHLISWKRWGNYLMNVSGIPLEIWIIILEMKFKMEKWDMIRYMETLGLNLVKDYCFNGQMVYTMIPRRSYLYEHIPAQFRYDIDTLRNRKLDWRNFPKTQLCCRLLSYHTGLLSVSAEMLKLEEVMKKWGSMFVLITRDFVKQIKETEEDREKMGKARHIVSKHWEFTGNWWFHVGVMKVKGIKQQHSFFKECLNLYKIWRCNIWHDVNSMEEAYISKPQHELNKCCKNKIQSIHTKNIDMQYFFEQYLVCGVCEMCRDFEHYFFQHDSWESKDESVCGQTHEFNKVGELIIYQGYKAPI